MSAVRRFNRFYTRQIGILDGRYLRSPFSLTEVRVLYELAHREETTASELVHDLALDPGYLSRMLRSFVRRGIVARSTAAADGRMSLLTLSARGRKAFAPLDAKAARFVKRFDPKRERCWIAELDGEPVGSVFCVKQSQTVAKLRLLLVEPRARGLGIGRRLVDECVAFARSAGYREMVLWTNDVLVAARHIYERAGFTLVESERHTSFGKRLVGESWRLRL